MKENKNIVNNNTINEENLNKKSSYLSENLNLKTSEILIKTKKKLYILNI